MNYLHTHPIHQQRNDDCNQKHPFLRQESIYFVHASYLRTCHEETVGPLIWIILYECIGTGADDSLSRAFPLTYPMYTGNLQPQYREGRAEPL